MQGQPLEKKLSVVKLKFKNHGSRRNYLLKDIQGEHFLVQAKTKIDALDIVIFSTSNRDIEMVKLASKSEVLRHLNNRGKIIYTH